MNLRRRTFALGIPAILACSATGTGAAKTFAPIADYERESGGRVGIYAENVLTGSTLSWRADEHFIMCSTFKASLVAFVLVRIDRGKDDRKALVAYDKADLKDVYAPVATAHVAKGALSVEEMCKAAIEISDGACANLLLARVGGPAALTSFWRAAGDDVSRLDHYEPYLDRSPSGGSRDATTPAAIARTLRKFVLGHVLSERSRTQFKGWLIGCRTGEDRLRAGLPRNWVIADKTGHNGRDVAGDIAIGWPTPNAPIVICAFTRGGSPTEAQFDDVFKGVGRLVSSTLS